MNFSFFKKKAPPPMGIEPDSLLGLQMRRDVLKMALDIQKVADTLWENGEDFAATCAFEAIDPLKRALLSLEKNSPRPSKRWGSR